MSGILWQVVRGIAIVLNLIAFVLEMNLEIQTKIRHLPTEWNRWTRAEEFAPLFALIVILWASRRLKQKNAVAEALPNPRQP